MFDLNRVQFMVLVSIDGGCYGRKGKREYEVPKTENCDGQCE